MEAEIVVPSADSLRLNTKHAKHLENATVLYADLDGATRQHRVQDLRRPFQRKPDVTSMNYGFAELLEPADLCADANNSRHE